MRVLPVCGGASGVDGFTVRGISAPIYARVQPLRRPRLRYSWSAGGSIVVRILSYRPVRSSHFPAVSRMGSREAGAGAESGLWRWLRRGRSSPETGRAAHFAGLNGRGYPPRQGTKLGQ